MNALSWRVLVVDDSELVRRSICSLLKSEADIEVISEACDGVDAVRKAREHKPDMVLMDITMPSMNGLEATRLIKRELPSTQILMVSQFEDAGFLKEALAAGASGYVVKSAAHRELLPAVRRIQPQNQSSPSDPRRSTGTE